MDAQTQALLDSLTEEQMKSLRKMLATVLPVFKVFAEAIISVLDEDQKAMLAAIVAKEHIGDGA